MSDRRLWVKVDRGYLDNPKMIDVLDASSTAPLMHLASILYSAQHLTDGHIAPGVARRKVGGTKDDERLLIDSGLWHEPGHDCGRCPQPTAGKVYIHDYLEHNQTAEKVEEVSAKRSRAAQKRWKSPDDATSMQSASKLHSKTVQLAMQRREEERRGDSSVPADAERGHHPDEFDAWYSGYPKKVAKGAAKKAFDSARAKVSVDVLTKGRDAYAKAVKDTDKKFIKNPATWLNAECWADEHETHNKEVSQWDLAKMWNTQK